MDRNRPSSLNNSFIDKLLAYPRELLRVLSGLGRSWTLRRSFQELELNEHEQRLLLQELKQALRPTVEYQPTLSEQKIVAAITEQTQQLNRNNVARTAAYLEIYLRHPELHWAFLAHMVSRNGGWSMTDLKGEWLTRLMKPEQAEHFFAFLERANALIFQDAYPQLRLYEESLRRRQSLFHLLPAFHVSAFMKPFWDRFWNDRQPSLLTTALIINEQNYIESRVIQNEHFRRTVLDTAAFQAQALLQLNQVLLPYIPDTGESSPSGRTRLAGAILENFSNLEERIGFGKVLYTMLFGIPEVRSGAMRFASIVPHSGSRQDIWPQLYSSVKSEPPGIAYTERLDKCMLRPGAAKLYSPTLKQAWPDQPLAPIERNDWFRDLSMLELLVPAKLPERTEMTQEYCLGLRKIELAVIAGQVLEPLLP
jgi:hypothetical protein